MEVVKSVGSPPAPHEVFVRSFSSLATEFDIASGLANNALSPHPSSCVQEDDRGEPWENNEEENDDEEEREEEEKGGRRGRRGGGRGMNTKNEEGATG